MTLVPLLLFWCSSSPLSPSHHSVPTTNREGERETEHGAGTGERKRRIGSGISICGISVCSLKIRIKKNESTLLDSRLDGESTCDLIDQGAGYIKT